MQEIIAISKDLLYSIIINELKLFINFFDTFDFEKEKYVHFEFGPQKISMHR